MSTPVNFRFGSKFDEAKVNDHDLVVINEGFDSTGSDKYGSVYKGKKMVGTTKADSLYTTEKITIAGGPLEDSLRSIYGDFIPAGVSLQELFEKLACKEIWPDAKVTTSDGTVGFGALDSIVITRAAGSIVNSSDTLFIPGTELVISDYSGSSINITKKPSIKFSGFTYGFSTEKADYNGDGQPAHINPSTVSADFRTINSAKITLTQTIEGFEEAGTMTQSTEPGNFDGTTVTIEATNVTVNEGTNTVKFSLSASSNTHNASITDKVYYAYSNLYNVLDGNGDAVEIVDASGPYNFTAKPSSLSKERSIIGVYPIISNGEYLKNGSDASKTTKEGEDPTPLATQHELFDYHTKKTFYIDYPTMSGKNGRVYRYLYIPTSYKLTGAVVQNENTLAWDVDQSTNLVDATSPMYGYGHTVSEYNLGDSTNSNNVPYRVYTFKGANGPQVVKYTIEKVPSSINPLNE